MLGIVLNSGNKVRGIVGSVGVDDAVLGSVYGWGDECREGKMQKESWRMLSIVLDSDNEMQGVVDSVGAT